MEANIFKKKEDLLRDLRNVTNSVSGKRYLKTLLLRCGLLQISYGPNLNESNICFNEGQRSVALKIWEDLLELDINLAYEVLSIEI
jgi:hypothetical protein